MPRNSVKTDWEVELAVVIGRTARYLDSAEEGLAHVAGYATAHDVSEREFQIERGGTWDKGKNCETFNPLGPWLVTADEVPDPQALSLKLWVNGELKQDGTTAEQIFPVGEVVRYLSHFMTLYPGDVINTGTPAASRWATRTRSRTCARATSSSWRSKVSDASARCSRTRERDAPGPRADVAARGPGGVRTRRVGVIPPASPGTPPGPGRPGRGPRPGGGPRR